jgi:predicted HicB family RNase H-like nuclease
MSTSDAQLRANAKYLREKVDDIKIRVPKGEKDMLKLHARNMGESLNAFIVRAINETLERDKKRDRS